MSKVSELLKERANDIKYSSPEEVAVMHLKQAGFSEEDARYEVAQLSFEKEATATLVAGGFDVEKAAALVKSANVDLRSLPGFAIEVKENPVVDLLMKTAEYIEQLESHVELLEKAASEVRVEYVERQETKVPEPLSKMAGAGALTFADLEELQKIDQGTLTKIASAMEEPWSMGKAVGQPKPDKTDPLLAWILA